MAPQLRGIVQASLKKDIFQGIILGCVAAAAWKFAYADPKKRKYEAFYKNYDAEKAAKEIQY